MLKSPFLGMLNKVYVCMYVCIYFMRFHLPLSGNIEKDVKNN